MFICAQARKVPMMVLALSRFHGEGGTRLHPAGDAGDARIYKIIIPEKPRKTCKQLFREPSYGQNNLCPWWSGPQGLKTKKNIFQRWTNVVPPFRGGPCDIFTSLAHLVGRPLQGSVLPKAVQRPFIDTAHLAISSSLS